MSILRSVLTSVVSLPLLMGCKTQTRPISKQELIGKYVYHLEDKGQGTTCFTLRGDGTFIAGNENFSTDDGPKLPPEGAWQLFNGADHQELDLAHAGFPLERSNSSIKALVNNDLGTSCDLSN
jgi:hypothetical protein